MSKNIVIYTSNTCPFCTLAKDFFKDKGFEFTEKNVQTDAKARDELVAKGYTGVPVINIDGEEVIGFDKNRLEEILAK